MARGAKRLTGFTTVNLGYYVAGSAGWSTLGFNKQEVEALNMYWLLAPVVKFQIGGKGFRIYEVVIPLFIVVGYIVILLLLVI